MPGAHLIDLVATWPPLSVVPKSICEAVMPTAKTVGYSVICGLIVLMILVLCMISPRR
jgi:hypothetical protein